MDTMLERAFQDQALSHLDSLYATALRLTRRSAEAEDLVQETFLRVWNGRRGYEPRGKFTTWLFQIAKNHWLNEADKRRRLGQDATIPHRIHYKSLKR